MDKWTKRFIKLAINVSEWSKDPDAKVGCVLVSPDRKRFAFGYNGFATGIEDDITLFDKVTKNELTIHAEQNAIYNAGDVTGWSAYVTKACCMTCANALIQSGIVEVTMPKLNELSSWHKSQIMAEAIFNKVKINVNYY